MNKIEKVIFGFAGLALFVAACAEPVDTEETEVTETASKPNVVLVMVDDMGFSDIGAYGSEVQTPNLDLLADTRRFADRAICPAGWAERLGRKPTQESRDTG